ncbi:hypothetical protein D3C86_1614790 [compost metagenome]
MLPIVGFLQARVVVGNGLEAAGQGLPGVVRGCRYLVPGADVAAAAFHGTAVGHGFFDGAAQAAEVVRQVGGGQRSTGGDHAAADVHADRRRDDRADGGDHAANGRALAQVHVGHHGQVLEDEGQLGGGDQLRPGLGLDGHTLGPEFDWFAARDFEQIKGGHGGFLR